MGDIIINDTCIHLGWKDRIKILLGCTIKIETRVTVSAAVEVLGTQQDCQVNGSPCVVHPNRIIVKF